MNIINSRGGCRYTPYTPPLGPEIINEIITQKKLHYMLLIINT